MSLTTILLNKEFKPFRELLKESFPNPLFKGTEPLLAMPKTNNYMLIGVAFDYLLRFKLKKAFKDKVYDRRWVAESALERLKSPRGVIFSSTDPLDDPYFLEKMMENRKPAKKQNIALQQQFDSCKQIYEKYINSKLKDNSSIIKSTLFLAKLDAVSRRGPAVMKHIDFSTENVLNVEDLMQLDTSCDLDYFRPNKKIVLNPTFGKGSKLVGGADADLIIDDTLIDVKTTTDLSLKRPMYNQLLGYYLLYRIGGVDGHKNIKIKKLGIYFSRHNVLWTISIKEIGTEKKFMSTVSALKREIKKNRFF